MKRRKSYLNENILFCVICIINLQLTEYGIRPYANLTGLSFGLLKALVWISLSGTYIVTYWGICEFVINKKGKQNMIRKIPGWIVAISSTVAFIILMCYVCGNIESVASAIAVVVSSAALFVPNTYVLVQLLTRKDGQKD